MGRNIFKHVQMNKLLFILLLLLALLLLSSCGFSSVGTIPSGTPDRGNGTPAVVPTAKLSPQPVLTAPPTATGAFYAFVRKNQLWVAVNGAKPEQVTHFDYTNLPDVFWHQPAWSSDHRSLAFIMTARPVGQGGGGCPAPDYGANGALYVLNTVTQQLTAITVSSQAGSNAGGSPRNDYWQYVFWEDATHLLAWYNGPTGKTSNLAGLYRYDMMAGTLAQVIPLSELGVATLFNAQPGLPLLLSMRYSSEQLFYQVTVHPFEQQSQLSIYRHSVAHPEIPGSKVLDTGAMPWCVGSRQSAPFVRPGWDISPDGEQLAAQMVTANAPAQGSGTITVYNMKDGVSTALFAQAPSQLFVHDLTLTWGPDNRTVVTMMPTNAPDAQGLYSATLANPAATQQYSPALPGQIAWRSDSSAFALESVLMEDAASVPAVYVFVPGQEQGRLLLNDAQIFEWG